MKNPKISIIIPVYNVCNYIHRCLDSCINQTFQDIEIILIDDCSSDDSLSIAYQYATKDSRIKVFCNPQNIGTFHTRLTGLRYSSAEYILFLDGDDFLDQKTCQNIYNKLLLYPINPDIVCFGMRFFPSNLKHKTPKIITTDLETKEILKDFFLKPTMPSWSLCGKLYKKTLLTKTAQKLEFIDEKLLMAEDALMSLVIATLATTSAGIKDKLYIYCQNPTSITNQYTPQIRDAKINNLKKIIHYLEYIQKDKELSSNPYFYQAKNKMQQIIRSTIELEYRYDTNKSFFPSYLKACIRSLSHYKKWQTYVRIASFILSFGTIKI